MSDLMSDIYRALGGPWDVAADIEDALTPDREVLTHVQCTHLIPNPDSVHNVPCNWQGKTIVALYFDPPEAIWRCPSCGSENTERYGDIA